MLYKEMTLEEWQNLKAQTEAWLDTDIKEYKSGVELLNAWTYSRSLIEPFKVGNPERYIATLTRILTELKNITHYPKIISKDNAGRIYMAHIPVNAAPERPDIKPRPTIEPPATPVQWNRYQKFETYKDSLPEDLRIEGEENLDTWFTNRRRLHDLAKNQVSNKVDKTIIAKTLDNLDKQNLQIEGYYARVDAFFNPPTTEEPNMQNSTPSGRYTKEQIDAMTDVEFRAACKMKRIEANRKYLIRKDVENNESERQLRLKELTEWGITIKTETA